MSHNRKCCVVCVETARREKKCPVGATCIQFIHRERTCGRAARALNLKAMKPNPCVMTSFAFAARAIARAMEEERGGGGGRGGIQERSLPWDHSPRRAGDPPSGVSGFRVSSIDTWPEARDQASRRDTSPRQEGSWIGVAWVCIVGTVSFIAEELVRVYVFF